MRAIDGDALIKKAYDEAKGMAEPYDDFGMLVEWLVDKAPTIEPERKTGKWIPRLEEEWYGDQAECPLCGHVTIDVGNFCPNCGADMRGN